VSVQYSVDDTFFAFRHQRNFAPGLSVALGDDVLKHVLADTVNNRASVVGRMDLVL